MTQVIFYFQLHQPYRLHPERDKFLWDERNSEVLEQATEKCYVPALKLFIDLVRKHPQFKITLGVSGTFLHQALDDQPFVIALLRELCDVGRERRQVEFLDETYYHSLTGLFTDPARKEFVEQVSRHRNAMVETFDLKPTAFRNTELLVTEDLARLVADMGYRVLLGEPREPMRVGDTPPDCSRVYRFAGNDLAVVLRHRELSNDIARRFTRRWISPRLFVEALARASGDVLLMGFDFEHIGGRYGANTGIFEFWRGLSEALEQRSELEPAVPSEIAESHNPQDAAILEIPEPAAEPQENSHYPNACPTLTGPTQRQLFSRIQEMETTAREAGGELLNRWRHLTAADHLYMLNETGRDASLVQAYSNPYEGSLAEAVRVVTDKLWDQENSVKAFYARKKTVRTPVLLISPETDRLPTAGMGEFAEYVTGKSGGMGEVVAALCRGLTERNIPTHLITLDLDRHFRQKAGVGEEEWLQRRSMLDTENIHLVRSALFEDYQSAYDGDPLLTACEFQRQIINSILMSVRGKYDGRAIIHSHDWMAGGAVAAYARMCHIPLLHTVHNTHTGFIPLEFYQGVNLARLGDNLYLDWDKGRHCIDAQATAIKNADYISYVGKTFLAEVINDFFLDRHIIPAGVRQETQMKWKYNTALVVPNGISPAMYPENQFSSPDPLAPGLAETFGPDSPAIIAAKKRNLIKFQLQMGLNTDLDAILLFWPSRLDEVQKGVELLEYVALEFVRQYPDVQIAIVGNPVSDAQHAVRMGQIACSSGGKISYRPFDEKLSILGYAAASDVFGASLYEPFGQIDVVGNLYGATATNRDTGGYHDKIIPLSLKARGAPVDRGNGVLFKDYSPSGLWWGLRKTVENHRYFRKNPDQWEAQARRLMSQARENWSLDNMVAGYITAYEKLNDNKPLA